MSETIAIIGAGLAGLTAARILSHRGARIAMFEKSRGLGGRLATRRTDFGSLDHGTPYIETADPKFRALLTGLSQLGSVSNWEPQGKTSQDFWHIGMPTMSTMLKPMAEQTRVHFQAEVKGIAPHKDKGVDIAFVVAGDGTEQVAVSTFDRVILAIPAPQAARLLAQSGPDFAPLSHVTMAPIWTGLFAFDGKVDALQPHCLTYQDADIAWLGHNGSKPERTPGSYILHMTEGYSAQMLETERDAMADILFEKLSQLAGTALPAPLYAKAHRWRFGRTLAPLGQPFITNQSGSIAAIGDWCLGQKAEHAFESARQLTEYLKGQP